MKATIYYGAGDIRLETVPDPTIADSHDAIVRVTRAAICGSDLWFYRGISNPSVGAHTGHEFVGIVEAIGKDVRSVRPGEAVIAPFAWSDGTCEFCHEGLQTSCAQGNFFGSTDGGQGELIRVPFADGTLVRMPDSLASDNAKRDASVALCDVMATGFHGVIRADTMPGSTVVVIGDGAVGLCAVHAAAKEAGAETIIAVGHSAKRLMLAKQLGATHTFNSHDADVDKQIVELTRGGAPHAVEAVGNEESLEFAVNIARPGGTISFVGAPHNASGSPISRIFYENLTLRGGVAPARAYLPHLISSLEAGRIDPSPVFDVALPLDRVAEGYAAMDARKAIKVLLTVGN